MSAPFKLIFFLLILINSFLAFGQTSYRDLSTENWTFNKQNDSKKLPAFIPGTVHTDLLQNHQIPDPFFGQNEKDLQWIENETWEYETNFFISKKEFNNQSIDLEFDGLDTYTTVFLNGKEVLEADNMFRKWSIAVKKNLKVGTNHLKVVFHSAVQKGKDEAQKLTYTLPEKERVFVRKAQYQFGWDWAPRFVTAGIWKPVQLKFWNTAVIQNVTYELVSLNDTLAETAFHIRFNTLKASAYTLKIYDKTYKVNLPQGLSTKRFELQITNPQKWWCNGYGEPFVYEISILLQQDKMTQDEKKVTIGLRDIKLIRTPDTWGETFYFTLNGKPVYSKGANVIPPHSFLHVAKASTYERLVDQAVDANMNMLRVWGGGVYFDDAFYEACNRKGILVWQDFMFACAMYPADEDFLENVKQEATQQVERLGNHPSIALWCGNNEIEEGWFNWGWQKEFEYSAQDSLKIWNDYQKLFHQILPRVLEERLPQNSYTYWASSPSLGWGRTESLLRGDVHYWGVWWGKEPFSMYQKKVGRFVSEYGFQGMPALSTFQKMKPNETLSLTSATVRAHQKHPVGYETILEYMARDFDVPERFEDMIYTSQYLQAEGMKIAIEAHRRAKPYNMGTLYWQLNDCWPVTSWSSVDFFGNWKASHYQVRKSYAPLLLSVVDDNEEISVFVVNDLDRSFSGQLHLSILDFSGKIIDSKVQQIEVVADSSQKVAVLKTEDVKRYDFHKMLLQVRFQTQNELFETLYFHKSPKDTKLPTPDFRVIRINETTLEIQSKNVIRKLYLEAEETHFSDNFLDLLPNMPLIIQTTKPVSRLQWRTLEGNGEIHLD
jgi:beta-mannosidase